MIRWLLSLHVVALQLWLVAFGILAWCGVLGLLYLAANPTGRQRATVRAYAARYAYRGARRPRRW